MPTKKSAKSSRRRGGRASSLRRAKRSARKPGRKTTLRRSRAKPSSRRRNSGAKFKPAVPSGLKELVRQARALQAKIAKAV
jgi:hypothetical protein